jgi:hypothetical protein
MALAARYLGLKKWELRLRFSQPFNHALSGFCCVLIEL